MAGLSAQAKGRTLGIFEPSPDNLDQKRREHGPDGVMIDFMQRYVPAIVTPDGIRATAHGNAMSPPNVENYIAGKFGMHLDEVPTAMCFQPASLFDHRRCAKLYVLRQVGGAKPAIRYRDCLYTFRRGVTLQVGRRRRAEVAQWQSRGFPFR